MKRSIIAALAATALLCACGPRPESGCMSPGETGRIERIAKYDVDGRYGSSQPRAILRFGMKRYLAKRGAIRICVTEDDEALALLRIGDVLRPNGMMDVTP
jgi:hypothetical protein